MIRSIIFTVLMLASFAASAQTDDEIMTTATTTAIALTTAAQSKHQSPAQTPTPTSVQISTPPHLSDVIAYRPSVVDVVNNVDHVTVYPITVRGVPCVVITTYDDYHHITNATSISCGWGTSWPKQ
jgi:hypothetical protein